MEILKSVFGKNKKVEKVGSNGNYEEVRLDWVESTQPLREIEVRMDGKTVKKIVPVLNK